MYFYLTCGDDTDRCNSSFLTRKVGRCSNELHPPEVEPLHPACNVLLRSPSKFADADFEPRNLLAAAADVDDVPVETAEQDTTVV